MRVGLHETVPLYLLERLRGACSSRRGFNADRPAVTYAAHPHSGHLPIAQRVRCPADAATAAAAVRGRLWQQ